MPPGHDAAGAIVIILNAHSVTTHADAPAVVAAAFAEHGCKVEIAVHDGEHVAERAREAVRRNCRLVVAGGGDGTVSAVAAVVAGTGSALGVLPMGTLNHFAKDLGMPLDLAAAARAIATGKERQVDVGEVNDRIFVNNSSIGAYPRIVANRERRQRNGRSKWLAHVQASLQVWLHYRRLRITLRAGDSTRIVRTPFLFVGNNEYELDGMNIGARLALDAGTLHVCMAPEITRLGAAGLIAATVAGRLRRVDRFESLLIDAFTVDASHHRLPVSLDGEVTVLGLPLQYRIRPRGLRVIAPHPATAAIG